MLFVTPMQHFDEVMQGHLYTLVLSPHYYWCRRSTRGFKSSAQAKKFASSMFDLDASFEYDVYTYNDELYFVAFDKKRIQSDLIEQGIDLNKVEKIYLSQAFFDTFQTPIAINEAEALVRINGVVVVVDQSFCSDVDNESELSSFAAVKLTPLKLQGLGTKSVGGIKRQLMTLASVAAVWFITTLINLHMTQNELLAKQEALRTTYKLPQTSFQLKSMLKRLEKIDRQQLFIREMLHGLTQHKRSFAASFQHLTLDTKKMELQANVSVDNKTKSELKKRLKKYAKSVAVTTKASQSLIKAIR